MDLIQLRAGDKRRRPSPQEETWTRVRPANRDRSHTVRLVVCLISLVWGPAPWAAELPQVDPTFKPAIIEGGAVLAMALGVDDKLLVSGWFSSINRTSIAGIARLTRTGALDPTFIPPQFDNANVSGILASPDGGAVMAGSFQVRTGTVMRAGVAKLTSTGLIDLTWPSLREFNGDVRSMALDSEGRILIGGAFTINRTRSKANLVRLLPTGFVDETLNATNSNEALRPTVNGPVQKIIALSEGRFLIGGGFTSVGGIRRSGVARLHPDGSADPTFDFHLDHDCCILDLAIEPDGKVLVGGSFTNFAALGLSGIVRLTPDGGLDETFQSPRGHQAVVKRILQSAPGELLLAGSLTQPARTNQIGVVRAFGDGDLESVWREQLVPQTPTESILSGPASELYHLGNSSPESYAATSFRIDRFTWQPSLPAPPQILAQADTVSVAEGGRVALAVDDIADPRPVYQWTRNGIAIPDANHRTLQIPIAAPMDAGEYRLQLSNALGVVKSGPIRLTVRTGQTTPGHLDLNFNLSPGIPGAFINGRTRWKDKTVIVGSFTSIGGVSRLGIAALNPDGTLDQSFAPSTTDFEVVTSAMPGPNDTLVVMGTINSGQRSKIVRLKSDGTLDPDFKPYLSVNGYILQAIYVTTNGLTYISGSYSSNFQGVFRLLADGTRDTTYRMPADAWPMQILGQPDGKILLLGNFNTVTNVSRPRLARLNANGSFDETFVPDSAWQNYNPERMTMLPDGSILVAAARYNNRWFGWGNFSPPKESLLRLHADGSTDSSYEAEWDEDWRIAALEVQPNGSVILAGSPLQYAEGEPLSLARLYSDGQRDYAFYFDETNRGSISLLANLTDDRLLVGGTFGSWAGVPRVGFVRLYAQSPPPSAPSFFRQPEGARKPEGANLRLVGIVSASPRAAFQWQKEGVNLPGETNRHLLLRNLKVKDSGEYQLVAVNSLGTALSTPVAVRVDPARSDPGAVDVSFYTGTGPNGAVNQVVELADGKLLIAGNFEKVDGKARPRLARLLPDGSLDLSFQPTAGPNSEIISLLVLEDGHIVVGGQFDKIGTVSRPNIAAFNADGSLDQGFSISASERVTALRRSSTGQILGCGVGYMRQWLATGRDDSAFKPIAFDGIGLAMDLQPDGKILLAGNFSLDGWRRPGIARFHADGSLDRTFDPGLGASDSIYDVVVQPDGKILIAGAFTYFDGIPSGCLARLNNDGTLDRSFDVREGAASGRIVFVGHHGSFDATGVQTLLLADDGQIILSGEFSRFANRPSTNLLRLYSDGAVDTSFALGAGVSSAEANGFYNWYNAYNLFSDRWVTRLQRAGERQLFVLGNFQEIHGASRPGVARIHAGHVPPAAPVIQSTPADLQVRTGTNLDLTVEFSGYPHASVQWFRNGVPIPAATRPTLLVTNVHRSDAGSYSCIVSNELGSVSHSAATVQVMPPRRDAGAVDTSFYADWMPGWNFASGTLESGGRITLAGSIGAPNGPSQPWWTRLNSDGSIDAVLQAVDTNLQSGTLTRAFALDDGSTLANGWLTVTKTGRVDTLNWMRIRPDGTMDPVYPALPKITSLNAALRLPNGSWLVAGYTDHGPRLYRFHANGTLDTNLVPIRLDNAGAAQLALDSHGRPLVAGDFTTIGGVRRSRIARLNPDLTIDRSFDPKTGPDGGVTGLQIQPNGQIVVSGWFNIMSGQLKARLARLNEDGTLDAPYPSAPIVFEGSTIIGMAMSPDGSIILAGFLQNSEATSLQLVRLNPDGTLDEHGSSSNTVEWETVGRGPSISVQLLGMSLTGKAVLAGTFQKLDGLPRPHVVRLLVDDGPRVAWERNASGWNLLWDEGQLEEAASVNGPWLPTPGATSPRAVSTDHAEKFYRLQVEP